VVAVNYEVYSYVMVFTPFYYRYGKNKEWGFKMTLQNAVSAIVMLVALIDLKQKKEDEYNRKHNIMVLQPTDYEINDKGDSYVRENQSFLLG
jgi:hypothetical protein